jgi:hypothetical protein
VSTRPTSARIRLGVVAAEARSAARLLRRLPGFLVRPVDSDAARDTVGTRLERRGDDFLAMARRFVYGSTASPYRQLLQHAGCEYGDLERLVHQDGVEGALTTLLHRGVFLTVEEFKGRRSAVRGSARVDVWPEKLVNPTAHPLLVAHSSGSRGPRTRVPLDLRFVREHAVNRRLSLEARGALTWRHALWGSAGGSDMSILLRFAVCGAPPQRWFTPLDSRSPHLPLTDRLSALAVYWGSRLAGSPLPFPRPTAFLSIARWMQETLQAGATPHLKTYVTVAMQLCEAAAGAGIGLAGGQFTLTGEPLTRARLETFARHGVAAASDYGSNETGQVGEPCGAPIAPDDLHLLDDLHAVIQPGAAGPARGFSPRALLITSLRPTAPIVLLNVSMGDEAWITSRSCGCALETAGLRRHLHAVRSFEKLMIAGRTFLDADVVHVLEELLPSRFGGSPAHYQLVEKEGEGGEVRLTILVDPAAGTVDLTAVADAFRRAFGDPRAWREGGIVRAISAPPHATESGKILHLHREPPAS